MLFLVITDPVSGQPETCRTPAAVQHVLETATHVPNCIDMTFTHYPPTTGPHFPVWADFRTFKFVLNPGYYVHSLEHGAVALLVNCRTTGNCDEDFARLQRIAAHYGQGPEQTCAKGTDFQGSGWCNAPLSLQLMPTTPGTPSIEQDNGLEGRSRRLWNGSLARRGSLRLEILSLTGRSLRRYDLGLAGPGHASAAWDPHTFKKEFPSARRVAMRLTLESTAGSRRLAESILTP